jgi:hypothetical protein
MALEKIFDIVDEKEALLTPPVVVNFSAAEFKYLSTSAAIETESLDTATSSLDQDA